MLWLWLFACEGDEGARQEEEDAAYAAGCDEGQVAGTVSGADDGKACRAQSDVPLETARKGMLKYCGGKTDVDAEVPCYWWEIGYLDCWRAGYDMSYPVAWDEAGCEADSGS